jgi:polyketide biosynthesis enoyl-CoA hydratase PksI
MMLRRLEGGLALLQIATPDAPYLSEELPEQLHALLCDPPPDVRAIVFASSGDYFSAGASRASLLAATATDYAARVPAAVLRCPVPTVAAMEGHAIGGGLVLGLLADVVLLADRSLYGANFASLGFTPGMGATAVVEELCGPALARELLLGGRLFTGSELRERGVPCVWPREQVKERALAIAAEMAEVPGQTSRALKRCLAARRLARIGAAVAEEQQMHAALFGDPSTLDAIACRYGR